MNEISRAEDETAWWTHQKEWEEATVRSVVARRARLQKTQKEIDKRFKEIANIKKEIQRRKDRIVAIKAMTREHRLKIAKAQAEKAKYHMVRSLCNGILHVLLLFTIQLTNKLTHGLFAQT